MARVTAEDCVVKIPNRFELVMLAAQRARELSEGAPLKIDRDNDKNPVVALREIAGDNITPAEMREHLIRNYQKVPVSDDLDEDLVELMDGEETFTMPAPEDLEGALESEELSADQLTEDGGDDPVVGEEDESADAGIDQQEPSESEED